MHSSPPPTTVTITYTTIPISGSDVISRSIQNLASHLSTRRPFSELLSLETFDRPESLSIAGDRIRKNTTYFRTNYVILVLACTCLSLIGSPMYMIFFALILTLWLVLYFFREDPLVVSDRVVLLGLILLSGFAIWLMGIFGNLFLGVGCGLVLLGIHGVLRNPDGLFLDEDEAVSNRLIGPRSGF